eukprot:48468_1
MMHNIYLLTIAFIVFNLNSISHGSELLNSIDSTSSYLDSLESEIAREAKAHERKVALFNQHKDRITGNYFSVQSEARIQIMEEDAANTYIQDHQKIVNRIADEQKKKKENEDKKNALEKGDKDMISGIEKAIGGIMIIANGARKYKKGSATEGRLTIDVTKHLNQLPN